MPFYSYLEGGVKFFVGLLQILNNKPPALVKNTSKIERAHYSFFTVQQVFLRDKCNMHMLNKTSLTFTNELFLFLYCNWSHFIFMS